MPAKRKKSQPTKIFVFSGPGGGGKTTLVKRLFRKKWTKDNFIKGISATTRQKRPGEKDKRDYIFLSKSEFLKLKKQGFFLENEKVVDNYYGTPKQFYLKAKKQKKHLALCIDVKGGMHLKKTMKQCKIVTIFITAPSQKELQKRMKKREESKKVIKDRIKLAKKELQFSKYYDYLVINQKLDTALEEISSILLKEVENK